MSSVPLPLCETATRNLFLRHLGKSHCDLSRPIAAVVLLVIDDAELTGGYTVYAFGRMDDAPAVRQLFDGCRMILGGVANLEGNLPGQCCDAFSEEVEVVQRKIFLVGCSWVIAMTYIQDIFSYIFLYDEPWTTAKTESLALPDGMEPQSLVFADFLSRLQFDDVTYLFAEVAAYILVIVDISKEADALRILAACIDEMLA